MPDLLFVGPTAYDLPDAAQLAASTGFDVRPPARRGDVDDAIRDHEPGVLALVDGRFHQCLAVGHAELRRAIQDGWSVWGLSSMGAIRACEMRDLGMRGYGRVFEHFLHAGDFQDDEVALLHAPDPPFAALSEPLVHLRYFMREVEGIGLLPPDVSRQVIDDLKARWYGERNLPALLALVERYAGREGRARVYEHLGRISDSRVKAHDLRRFLVDRAWEAPFGPAIPQPAPYWEPEDARPAAPA